MKLYKYTIAAAALFFALAFESRGDFERTSDYDYEAPPAGSYKLPVIKTAADGAVLDSQGRSKQLRELTRGRVTVMSFIYTRCASPKACPYATGVLMQLHEASVRDAALAKNLRLISMSFDPEGDSVKRMADYAKLAEENKSAAEWHFLTTRSHVELQPILDGYGQAVDRRSNPNDPAGPLNHTLRVYLIDREGRIRNIYSSGTLDPRLVLADVKTLLMESEGKQETVTGKVETEPRPFIQHATAANESTQP